MTRQDATVTVLTLIDGSGDGGAARREDGSYSSPSCHVSAFLSPVRLIASLPLTWNSSGNGQSVAVATPSMVTEQNVTFSPTSPSSGRNGLTMVETQRCGQHLPPLSHHSFGPPLPFMR
ncbi:hypothetical protein AHAS_Ahas14G0128800 [Arachis hypogaea]